MVNFIIHIIIILNCTQKQDARYTVPKLLHERRAVKTYAYNNNNVLTYSFGNCRAKTVSVI